MHKGYYGKITSEVYEAALRLRGDEDTCWEERIPLAQPPLIFGPRFPEDLDGDEVIAIWEAAHFEATTNYGKSGYSLESVTLYLQDNQNSSHCGEVVWEANVKPHSS
jgi:hypothetical protein